MGGQHMTDEPGRTTDDELSELLDALSDETTLEEVSKAMDEALKEEQPAGPTEQIPPEPAAIIDLYNPLLEAILAEGLELDSESRLRSPALAEAVESEGSLAAKSDLAAHIGSIFDRTMQLYTERGASKEALQDLQWIRERYDAGDRIVIEGQLFYDPEKGDIPRPNVVTVPVVTNAANILQILGIPLSMIAPLANNKYVSAVSKASMHLPYGMKSLTKAYKELRKEKKDPVKIARYTLAGVGAIIYGLPELPGSKGPMRYVYQSLGAAYLINQGLLMLKMFPDKVNAEMPDLSVIRADLKSQTERYHAALKKYAGTTPQRVEKSDLEGRLGEINHFLRHHLEKVALRDIDIEYDYSVAKVMGAAARADIQNDTCELTPRVLPGDDPTFTWAYVHETMHLDGTKNEGKANFRADRVLEDIAAHHPNDGYDLMIEEMRFAAVGHSFAAKLMGEANRLLNDEIKKSKEHLSKQERHHLVKTFVYNELREMDLAPEDIRAIWKWAYPKRVLKGILKMQSILGSDPSGGYTLDYYKLLKQEQVM